MEGSPKITRKFILISTIIYGRKTAIVQAFRAVASIKSGDENTLPKFSIFKEKAYVDNKS